MTTSRPVPEIQDEFKAGSLGIFEFTAEDLRTNERGQMTPRQQGWLRSMGRGIQSCSVASAPIALLFVMLGLGIMLALYLQNEDTRATLFANPQILLVLAGTGVIAVAAIGFSVFLARRQASAITRAGLMMVQGPVRLDRSFSPGSGITSYHVLIGDQKFSYTDDMSDTFHEGTTYRVFFCKSGPYKLIMSFQELGGQGAPASA
jgi:hypothetical protein